ncbi:structural maintenance of chromosomes protein 4 [Tribolium castaneum]|uniref:structural maintenance of chromosomes protein 4 n=1 Tax=Tribolium castaneum TaxID=7070 RepID=UPI0030FE91F1
MTENRGKKREHPDNSQVEEDLNFSDEEGIYVDDIYIPPPLKRRNVEKSQTRLIITKIVNNYFKSYAENVVLGPFSKCFNAIIGPNGSGKSNVIDSMLFVFGYRATRMRCKKLSVLIHNSERYPNVQSCNVAVHFCEIVDKPGEEYEVVPGSEFVVSRTANRDNSSFYELNGRRVQFKEIGKLLKGHGIDIDTNRFLILQGEVEEIAMMKCKGANENEIGMLEYLEDIIGTHRYKKPLEQLNERIEYLSDLRTEKLNRLTLIEKQLEQLKGPMEEALTFLKTENKIAVCKNFLHQKELHDLEAEVKEVEEDKAKLTQSRDGLIAELKTISDEKTEKEKILKQEAGKYEKLQQKKDQLKDAFNAADKKDAQLQAEMTNTNNNRKKFKQQLEDEKKKLIKLQKVPEENAKLIGECEKRERDLTSQHEKLQAEKAKLMENIGHETKDLQVKKEQFETKLGKLKKTVDTTKNEYDLASTQLNFARSSEETEQEKLNQLRETIKNKEACIKERSGEVSQLKKKIPLTEKSLNDAQHELDAVKSEQNQIEHEIRRQRMSLEETRASMNSSKSRGRVLDALMQQKREGKCPGLYGRLGDLGGIDQKYDVAISTACGPLDNVVVDTADTAAWCIDFLKTHGIGRVTFIALDKQEYLRERANTRIQTPENVHRLYDLIQVQDDTVKTAFYYALRDTLVADDLDQGTRIAFGAQRFRVVTLKGEIMEPSGTMSGGGKTVSRGRMGRTVLTSTIDPKELEKMQVNIEKKEERLRQLTQKMNSLESQIRTLKPEFDQMRINYEKFSKDLQSLNEEQPLLYEKLRQQETVAKSTKSDPKEIKKLAAIVDEKKAEYEKALNIMKEIQDEVDNLNKAIKEKTSGKLVGVEKKIDEAVKMIEKCKTEITRLKVAITTSQRNLDKTTQKIATLEQNIVDCENRLRTMKQERDEIEADGQQLLKCIEDITEKLTQGKDDNVALKEEVTVLTSKEKELLLKKVDIDQAFKAINKKVQDYKTTTNHLCAKLKQLKVHDVPEEPSELKTYTEEELESINVEQIKLDLHAAQTAIKDMEPNLNVIEEYRVSQNVYMERSRDVEEVTRRRSEVKSVLDNVKTQRRNEFMQGYNTIRLKLKEMYQMITLGGDADFEIVDPCDPFAEGVQLNVRPPRKCWKTISNLSGGEKTLSSLALVFALHYYKPSPLYVMDEIDAALDFKNVSIVAHYIKERTKDAQFIIISLRANMFELCDLLVGIYKIFNCTRSITVDPYAFEKERKQQNGENKENQVEQNGIVNGNC